MTQRTGSERGSASIEMVLLTPALLALLLFVVAGGRIADARARVDGAARDAARAASIERSPERARRAAVDYVNERLGEGGASCREDSVDVSTEDFRPGGVVRVTVNCVLDLADVTSLGIPGSRSVTATATEVVDTYRGVGP